MYRGTVILLVLVTAAAGAVWFSWPAPCKCVDYDARVRVLEIERDAAIKAANSKAATHVTVAQRVEAMQTDGTCERAQEIAAEYLK